MLLDITKILNKVLFFLIFIFFALVVKYKIYVKVPYIFKIGVDFAMKILNWNENTIIRLQFWDIEGRKILLHIFYAFSKGLFEVKEHMGLICGILYI